MFLIAYPLMWLMFLIITFNLIANVWISIVVMIGALLVTHVVVAAIGALTGDDEAFTSSLPIAPWMTIERQLNRAFNGISYANGWGQPKATKESPITFGAYAMLIATPFLYIVSYEMTDHKRIAYFGSIIAGAIIGVIVSQRVRRKMKGTVSSFGSDYEREFNDDDDENEKFEDSNYNSACDSIASHAHWSRVLYLDKNATLEEVKRARNNLLKDCHPDLHTNETDILDSYYKNETIKINKAYEEAKKELG